MIFTNWKKRYIESYKSFNAVRISLERTIDAKEEMIQGLTSENKKLEKSNVALKSYNTKYKDRIKNLEERVNEQYVMIQELQKQIKKK